jgi:hypothetical protein
MGQVGRGVAAAPQPVAIDLRDPLAPREIWRLTLPEHVWALAAGAGTTVYAGTDNAIVTLDIEDPDLLVRRGHLEMGQPGAARAVRGLAFAGDRLYANLSPPRGMGQPQEIGRFIAGLATLRSIAILPDGGLRPLGDLDLAANLNTGAAHRPVVGGAYVAVSGGPVGVALARRPWRGRVCRARLESL